MKMVGESEMIYSDSSINEKVNEMSKRSTRSSLMGAPYSSHCQGRACFATIDVTNAYFQIPLDKVFFFFSFVETVFLFILQKNQ